MEYLKRLKNINSFFIISCFFLLFFTILFMLNRGFDFSDEGALLLSYENVSEYKGGVLNHHLIVHFLFNWLSPSIVMYRILNLILFSFSAISMYLGVRKWVQYRWGNESYFIDKKSLFCLIFLSVLIYYFLGFHTLSYNSFIHVSLLFFVSIMMSILIDFNMNLTLNWKNISLLTFLGFIIGSCFFIKFSTSILLYFSSISLLSIYIFFKGKYSYIFVTVSSISLGVICSLVFYFYFIQSFSLWKSNFQEEMSFLSTHRPIQLVYQYLFQLQHFVVFFLKYFSWIMVYPFVLFTIKKNKLRTLIFFSSILFFLFEVFYFKFYQSTYALKPWYNAYLYLFVIFYSSFYMLFSTLKKKGWSIKSVSFSQNLGLYIFCLFSITPIIGSLGTANPIFLNCLWHGTTWILLSLYFIYDFYLKYKVVYLLVLFYTLIIITSSQIIDGNLFHPYYSISYNYGLPNNGFDQTYRVNNNLKLKGILVDKDTKDVIEKLNHIYRVNNFNKGIPTIGFFMPGLIYVLDGVSPYSYYYFNLPRDAVAIEKSKFNDLILLVTDAIPVGKEVKNALKKKKMNFPMDFDLIDSLIYPKQSCYLKIYKLHTTNNEYN
jgi:hypothetical protein